MNFKLLTEKKKMKTSNRRFQKHNLVKTFHIEHRSFCLQFPIEEKAKGKRHTAAVLKRQRLYMNEEREILQKREDEIV